MLYMSFLRKSLIVQAIPCFFILLFSDFISAQTPVLSFTPLISAGLSTPLDIVNAADGSNRLFIAQQDGRIRYARGSALADTIFLDISKIIATGGERGLLSIAFHPQYQTNGYLFVYYTNTAGNLTLARYQVSSDPNKADSLTAQVLLTVPHTEFSNHNGGKLNFGADGNLYLSIGDGGSGGDPHFNSQNGDTLLGKMIRINVDNFSAAPFYQIPADNPYTTPGDGVKDEIWAMGLRNPFRWSFDRLTHDMWIGDVGQGAREEINFRTAGSTGGINYGWRCYEGNLSYNDSGCQAASNYIFPVFEYDRTATGGTSVTGGMVYRGTDYPALYGWYVCIDFFSTNGWIIRPAGNSWTVQRQGGLPTNIAGFGESENGEMYAVSLSGVVYQIQTPTVLPLRLESFSAQEENGSHLLSWKTATAQQAKYFEVEYSIDGVSFRTIGKVASNNSPDASTYTFNNRVPGSGKAFYRLKMVDMFGKIEYSSILNLNSTLNSVLVSPTLIENGRVSIQLNAPFRNLQLFDMNGRVVISKQLDQAAGIIYLDVARYAKGVYNIRLTGDGSIVNRKIVIR